MASCLCLPFPGPSPVQHHARRRSGHLCILCLCCLTYDVGDTGTIENSKSLWKMGSFSSQHEVPQRGGFSPSLGAPPPTPPGLLPDRPLFSLCLSSGLCPPFPISSGQIYPHGADRGAFLAPTEIFDQESAELAFHLQRSRGYKRQPKGWPFHSSTNQNCKCFLVPTRNKRRRPSHERRGFAEPWRGLGNLGFGPWPILLVFQKNVEDKKDLF